MEAKHSRPQLKERGLHNTGLCGFEINEQTCVGFDAAERIDLFEFETGLLIYSRAPRRQFIPQKFLLIEGQSPDSTDLVGALTGRFRLSYVGLGGMPEETLASILGIRFTNSIFAAGQLLYRVVERQARERGFKIGMVLCDPVEVLAELLVSIRRTTIGGPQIAATAVGRGLAEVARALADQDLDEPERLERCLRRLDGEARWVLADPLTRQMTALTPDEPLDPLAAAAALEALSQLDLVGIRSEPAAALEAIAATLELNELPSPPALRNDQTAVALTESLRNSRAVKDLLSEDMKVYAGVVAAIREVASKEQNDARDNAHARPMQANWSR